MAILVLPAKVQAVARGSMARRLHSGMKEARRSTTGKHPLSTDPTKFLTAVTQYHNITYAAPLRRTVFTELHAALPNCTSKYLSLLHALSLSISISKV